MPRWCERQATSILRAGVANTLNALAKFDHYDKAVVERLCAEVVRKAGDFNPQGMANTLHALIVSDHFDKEATCSMLAVFGLQDIALCSLESLSPGARVPV